MYQFVKDLLKLKCPPLMVREVQLTDNAELNRKIELFTEDVRPEFSKEKLLEGVVEFPVYRCDTIPFLGLKGKFCDYEVKKYGVGNLVEVIQKFGGLEVNTQDRRYTRPTMDIMTTRTYCFYYNYNEKRYKQEQNAERWKVMVEEAERLKRDEHVLNLMWNHIEFYERFWIKRLEFTQLRSLTINPTFLECMSYLYYLSCQCQDMRSFFAILDVFGEITEEEYAFLQLCLEHLEAEIDAFHDYLNGQVYERELNPDETEYDDSKHGKPLAKLEKFLEKLFRPAYIIDPIEEKMFPNIGVIYNRNQVTQEFSNADTIREKNAKRMKSAKKAFLELGKEQVNGLKDYIVAYVK